jgi:hypothetical protein
MVAAIAAISIFGGEFFRPQRHLANFFGEAGVQKAEKQFALRRRSEQGPARANRDHKAFPALCDRAATT